MAPGHQYDVAVVGGGLAGLVAAVRLAERGIRAPIFEASERLGGRIQTDPNAFVSGQYVERGGEFIASDHARLIRLARELGLELEDLDAARSQGTGERLYALGGVYRADEVRRDFDVIRPILGQAYTRWTAAAGHSFPEDVRRLDEMNVYEWIEAHVPGGTTSRLGRLITIASTVEYCADPADLGAINLIFMFGDASDGESRLFGGSDDRYVVRGGNERLVKTLVDRLPAQPRVGYSLMAAASRPEAGIQLTLATGGRTVDVIAQRVILAIPFSALRRVDLSGLRLTRRKRAIVERLGYGSVVKAHLQFGDRYWRALGCDGTTLSDTGYQCTWDATLGQAGESGILTFYLGGLAGSRVLTGGDVPRQLLEWLEPVLPGGSRHYLGHALVDRWTTDEPDAGAYSYWRPRQYTEFAGAVGVAEGPVHFAGEHTSREYQGYMEGAVRSGERAAGEVIRSLRLKARATRPSSSIRDRSTPPDPVLRGGPVRPKGRSRASGRWQ